MKFTVSGALGEGRMSLPSRERGLKFGIQNGLCDGFYASLPSRERGLKFNHNARYVRPPQSLPSRERGLKLGIQNGLCDGFCRSLRGSVD